MSTDTLDQLTDAELSEVFAVEYAGWTRDGSDLSPMRWKDAEGGMPWDYENDRLGQPKFATSADAVLPFTDAFPFCDITRESHLNGKPWSVSVARTIEGDDAVIHALAPTLARAICIALIRAKRAEKGAAA
jgi:hypothetical protein